MWPASQGKDQEAVVMVTLDDVRFSVSPVFTVLDAVSAMENRKLPALDASHSEMCVTTSPFVPAHVAHDGVLFCEITPPEAAANVIDGRVVTDDTDVVPAVPGFAVCSCTNAPVIDVGAPAPRE